MNTYRNRPARRYPNRNVKPAPPLTPEQKEALDMTTQIRRLCGQQTFQLFVTLRQEGAPIEKLRTFHKLVTDDAIERANALEADFREDQADRLDYARGQY